MTNKVHKKILLAVDGSDHALEAVKYISKLDPFQKMEVTLFAVHSRIPDYYWDVEREPPLGWRTKEVRAWDRAYEKMLEDHTDAARKILWRAGFPKEAVNVKIHRREKGIARDIVREAKGGYGSVVVARKGMSKVQDLVLGSVSTKLLERVTFVPLIVVGEDPQPGTVLVALDSSEAAMRAVDCVGTMLGGPEFEVGLIHVVRGNRREFLQEAKKEMSKVFDEAKSRLLKSGFESNQVTTKIITGVRSRAGAIIQEAKQGGYGTIVVGRRGLSKVSEFFMGRVSNKVIQTAKKHAVWVVN